MWKSSLRCCVTVIISGAFLSSCAADASVPRILQVPAKYATIQAAVDDANRGDIVEVSAGVYSESVDVSTDGVVIQGVDRNEVILDGRHKLPNGISVAANDVSIQNLTVHSYTQNGIVYNGIQGATEGGEVDPNVTYGADGHWISGYFVSHVTSYNNGLYGIYVFASTNGVIKDSYVSGHPDSGIYVGQCNPCNSLISGVTAEYNAIGYYGTNASGDVYVINSTFRKNRIGIAPNSQRAEKLSPQRETFVLGNRVEENDSVEAPIVPDGAFGVGIAIGGGTKNYVAKNLVVGHGNVGIAIMRLGEFEAENNVVDGNSLFGNRIDLAFVDSTSGRPLGNCFTKNVFSTSVPSDIERKMACESPASIVEIEALPEIPVPPGVEYKNIRPPQSQPSLNSAARRVLQSPSGFEKPNLTLIVTPKR